MFKETFLTSILTFYMKGEVSVAENFIKYKKPNTILKFIPMGAENKTIPVEQIASVESSFKLYIGTLIWGILLLLGGFNYLGDSIVGGVIVLLWGVSTIASALQTKLEISYTSGKQVDIEILFFESTKANLIKDEIEKLITQRYSDTNVAYHTDRSIKAGEENTERIVEAISKSKE